MGSIRIKPVGNIGNQILQHILAVSIARKVPGFAVQPRDFFAGPMAGPAEPGRRVPKIRGHVFHFDRIVEDLARYPVEQILISGLGFDCRNYLDHAAAAALVPQDAAIAEDVFSANQLVINVRGAEILGNVHSDYGPLPIQYYRDLIRQTGLEPVFLGQLGDDSVTGALRLAFPEARFVPSRGARVDFEVLRRARNLVLSVSTFSWLAGWMGQADRVFMPVMGLYNPTQRPDINLLPLDDPRYIFHRFPIRKWSGSEADKSALVDKSAVPEVGRDELVAVLQQARRQRAGERLKNTARFALEVRLDWLRGYRGQAHDEGSSGHGHVFPDGAVRADRPDPTSSQSAAKPPAYGRAS